MHNRNRYREEVVRSALTPSHQHVLREMNKLAETGEFFGSVTRLSRSLARSDRWIRLVIAALVRQGWLTLLSNRRGGRSCANRYELVIPESHWKRIQSLESRQQAKDESTKIRNEIAAGRFAVAIQSLFTEGALSEPERKIAAGFRVSGCPTREKKIIVWGRGSLLAPRLAAMLSADPQWEFFVRFDRETLNPAAKVSAASAPNENPEPCFPKNPDSRVPGRGSFRFKNSEQVEVDA